VCVSVIMSGVGTRLGRINARAHYAVPQALARLCLLAHRYPVVTCPANCTYNDCHMLTSIRISVTCVHSGLQCL